MNINLIYEGKNYNFDIPNNVTIDYLKELSSKIFNSEKELLDLIYNNKKVEDNGDNILIRDLIPEGETSAILTVQINKNMRNNKIKKKSERKISYEMIKENENNKMKNDNKNEKKEDKIKQKLEEENNNGKSEKYVFENIYNNNIQSKIKMMLNNNNNRMNKKERFNNEYIQKNGELLGLIRQFGDKIKKIYLMLYNKYKISNKNFSNNTTTISNVKTTRNINLMDNSFYELVLYEKKIMNYFEIQIEHYKRLIETIQSYDNNINFSKLSEFYRKLFIYFPEEAIIKKGNNIKISKEPHIGNKKLINNNSSINLTTSHKNNNKLPSLKLNYYKSPIKKENNMKLYLDEKNKKRKESDNEIKEKKLQKNNNIINKNINIEEKNIIINNNISRNNNNILDDISEKISIESNNEINKNIKNISPISLKKKIKKDNYEIENDTISLKEIKLNNRKDSFKLSGRPPCRNSLNVIALP